MCPQQPHPLMKSRMRKLLPAIPLPKLRKCNERHVSLCLQIFQQMTGNHSANASEITTQYLISAAAFLYQHPEVASDSTAQNVAGMDAALNVYEKFLADDSKTRFKFLDNLDKQRNDGKLKDAIQRICK